MVPTAAYITCFPPTPSFHLFFKLFPNVFQILLLNLLFIAFLSLLKNVFKNLPSTMREINLSNPLVRVLIGLIMAIEMIIHLHFFLDLFSDHLPDVLKKDFQTFFPWSAQWISRRALFSRGLFVSLWVLLCTLAHCALPASLLALCLAMLRWPPLLLLTSEYYLHDGGV